MNRRLRVAYVVYNDYFNPCVLSNLTCPRKGIIYDFWHDLSVELNFSIDWIIRTSFGSGQVNETNSLMSAVRNEEADITGPDLLYTDIRVRNFNYSFPLRMFKTAIFLNSPTKFNYQSLLNIYQNSRTALEVLAFTYLSTYLLQLFCNQRMIQAAKK